jgi:hypothetical protein
VNADFPARLTESPGRQARRLGANRQPIIKAWIAGHLERGISPA